MFDLLGVSNLGCLCILAVIWICVMTTYTAQLPFWFTFFFLHLLLFSPKPENHGASNRAPVVMRELIKVVDHSASIAPLQARLFS